MPVTLIQRFSFWLVLVAVATAATVFVALGVPHLGLDLDADLETDSVVVVAADNPAFAAIPAGTVLREIRAAAAGPGEGLAPVARDRIDEPDTLTYGEYDDFVARQDLLHGLLRAGPLAMAFTDADGTGLTVTVQAAQWRPVTALPFAFWYQIACGVIISVIGAWVQALSPRDGKVKLFALAGYGVALAVFTAAIYSTREIALDGTLFRVLGLLNNIGAMTFGMAMIGLFSVYPKDLGVAWSAKLLAVFFTGWIVANALQLLPSLVFGTYVGILTEMTAIIVLVAVQYAATRNDLRARRALTWLGMSVILGAGAFVLLVAVPTILGVSVALPQGYAFGFFVLIYLGVALGLTRYRLFELDRWAFSVFSYVLAAFVFAAVDFTLIGALALTPALSLGVAAIIVGLVYLPLRNFVLRRYTARREPDPYRLYRASTEIALRPTPAERAEGWRRALADFFQPINIEPLDTGPERPRAGEDGAVLELPAYPWSAPLRLRHYLGGRGLFGRPHARIVEDFASLVAAAEEQRDAYDRGVREERRRIGRDLHDSVSARLLSSLRAHDDLDARQMVRHALGDIREIVGGLSDRREILPNIIAELRAETMERLEGSDVDWPLSPADAAAVVLPYAAFRNFTSLHRELISNVIRHAPGAAVTVRTDLVDSVLVHSVANDVPDGPADGAAALRVFAGNGLDNIAARARQLGGDFDCRLADGRFTATVSFPLQSVEAAA